MIAYIYFKIHTLFYKDINYMHSCFQLFPLLLLKIISIFASVYKFIYCFLWL